MSGMSPQRTTPPPGPISLPGGPPRSGVLTPIGTPPEVQGGPPPNFGPFPPSAPTSLESLRFQHLYTLALADRMRLLNPLWPAPRPLPPVPPPSGGPDPFSLPYKALDPRYFGRPHPEEPKPQQSYIGLIAMAILSHQDEKLVLADIYQYILDNFAYFRQRGPGWRNSIRHNLSLNDCFIKAGRAANGKGHYWAIHTACVDDFKKGDFRRRKAQRKVRRHNLSINDCFIKNGRAANGKGHYWAIHSACVEDFKRGDFRRRKAQRKVRRHMGLAVDEEDSPSPPPPPPQGFFAPHMAWPPMPMRLHPPTQFQLPPLNPHPLPQFNMGQPQQGPPLIVTSSAPPSVPQRSPDRNPLDRSDRGLTSTNIRVKRQFDMASILKSESENNSRNKKDSSEQEIQEISSSNNNTFETETEANEDSTSWRSVSPPQGPLVSGPPRGDPRGDQMPMNTPAQNQIPSQSLMAHQYLARYYQLHLQHQSNPAAAAAAALAAAAAAVNAGNSKSEFASSPRGSPTSPILQERNF